MFGLVYVPKLVQKEVPDFDWLRLPNKSKSITMFKDEELVWHETFTIIVKVLDHSDFFDSNSPGRGFLWMKCAAEAESLLMVKLEAHR